MKTLEEQFNTARDITPSFGVKTVFRDGKTLLIPVLQNGGGALFVSDDQGACIDRDGCKWLIGTHMGELVKRRLA